MDETQDQALSRVISSFMDPEEITEGYMVLCPAHPDGTKSGRNSLHASAGDNGGVLLHCLAGCPLESILAAVDLQMKDLYPHVEKPQGAKLRKKRMPRVECRSQYEIKNFDGKLAAIHERKQYVDGSKSFSWRHPDGTYSKSGEIRSSGIPLYRSEELNGIMERQKGKRRLVVVEGEKAADALWAVGIAALGTVTGTSGVPYDAHLCELIALDMVVLWPDNDEAGRKHMRRVGESLVRLGATVHWFEWEGAPDKGDAADHPAVRSGQEVTQLGKALAQARPIQKPRPERIAGSVLVKDLREEFDGYLSRARGDMRGILTGIDKLDRHLGGFLPKESTVIGARTAVGKSILAGQIAYLVAIEGKMVTLQATEMGARRYLARIAHALSEVRLNPAEILSPQEVQRVDEQYEKFKHIPLSIDGDKPSMDDIRRNIEKDQPDLVIVDHLHRLKSAGNDPSRYREIGKMSEGLAELKSDYNIPILICAQLSRNIEHRFNKKPMLSDLKDSGDIEADADIVLLMHRPGFYDDEIDKGMIEVHCAKNRNGETFSDTLHQVQGQAWVVESPADVGLTEEEKEEQVGLKLVGGTEYEEQRLPHTGPVTYDG